MLLKTTELKEYIIELFDDIRGTIFEMYFNDLYWNIEYLLVTSDNLEKGKIVLISQLAFGSPENKTRMIPISANAGSIKRKEESTVHKNNEVSKSIDPIQFIELPEKSLSVTSKSEGETKDLIITLLKDKKSLYFPSAKHLRSHNEVLGYNIQVKDGDLIGHVDNFIVEGNTWQLKYLLVDTCNWLTAGKKILLSPAWIERINWSGNLVSIDLSRDSILKSPTYDPSKPLDDRLEMQLYKYYSQYHNSE